MTQVQTQVTIQELKKVAQSITTREEFLANEHLVAKVGANMITLQSQLEKNFPEQWMKIQVEESMEQENEEEDYDEEYDEEENEEEEFNYPLNEEDKFELEKAGFEVEDSKKGTLYLDDAEIEVIRTSETFLEVHSDGKKFKVASVKDAISEAIRIQNIIIKQSKTSNAMADEKKKNPTVLTGQKDKIFRAFTTVRGFMANGYPTAGVKPQTNAKGDEVTGQEAANIFYTRKYSSLKKAISVASADKDEKATAILKKWSTQKYEQQDATAFQTLQDVFKVYKSGEGRGTRAPAQKPTAKVTLDL